MTAPAPSRAEADAGPPAERGTGNLRTRMWMLAAGFVWLLSAAVPLLIVMLLAGRSGVRSPATVARLGILTAPLIGIILGAGAFATVRVCGYTPAVLGVRRRELGVDVRTAAVCFAAGIGLQLLTVVVDFVLTQFGVRLDPLAPYKAGLHGSGVLAVFVVTTLLTAPIGEELFFRGLLLGMATRTLPRGTIAWTPIVVVSLLFSAGHFNPDAAIQLCLVALVFGWMRCRTDSIVASVAAHIGLNLLPTLALLVGINV